MQRKRRLSAENESTARFALGHSWLRRPPVLRCGLRQSSTRRVHPQHRVLSQTMRLKAQAFHDKHDIFGWVSLLDGQPLPLRVMAKTPLTLAIVDLKKSPASPATHIENVLITELRRYLSTFVRTSLETRVADLLLQHEAEFVRYRNTVGSIVITTLALLLFYTLSLSLLPRFQRLLKVNFALSPIIIIFFFAFCGGRASNHRF